MGVRARSRGAGRRRMPRWAAGGWRWAAPVAVVAVLGFGTDAARSSPTMRRAPALRTGVPQRWQPPFAITPPAARRLAGLRLALASGGQAIAYASVAYNDPADSRALVFAGPAGGRIGLPRAIAGVARVLALAFIGRTLALLVGQSPRALRCCSTVAVLLRRGGRVVYRQVLLRHLAGPALGALIGTRRGLLAAVASAEGVWDDQITAQGRPGPARRLLGRPLVAGALAGVALGARATELAFSAASSPFSSPDEIFTARGSAARPPLSPRLTVSAPSGYEIDELALAGGRRSGLLAWTQSWIDASGSYRSQVYAKELGVRLPAQAISPAGALASGLSLAENAAGSAVIAYRACTRAGACELQAALRPDGSGRFAAVRTLGAIDPTQTPATAVSRRGQALVGFISGGRAFVAAAAPGARSFARARRLSRAADASQLAVAFTASGDSALAIWTEGVERQRLAGARLVG